MIRSALVWDEDHGFQTEDGNPCEGLTGIPRRRQCTATEDSGASAVHELARNDIENFLDALAQAALSVTARRAIKGQGENS